VITALALLLCLGAGIVAGVFFAFSTFVMKALSEVPGGAHAMQRINVVVLNPLFLGAFTGTALLSIVAAGFAIVQWHAWRSPWLLTAAIAYVGGCFLVTLRLNVPLNNRLAKLPPDSPEATQFWPQYVRDWTRWNHVRTAASTIASACATLSLIG
jgi:uncharacterized membrane protein